MNSPNTILESYVSAFRDLVNARVWGRAESPAKALRLLGDRDWNFICVAMDVVGDASLAVHGLLHSGRMRKLEHRKWKTP